MSSIDLNIINKMRAFLGDKISDILQAYITASEQNAARATGALQSGDVDALKMAVHSLKGSSGTVGATQVMLAAKQIEALCKSNQPVSEQDLEKLLREITTANQELRALL
jgi:HPt (histidine-containing phosphotransfer) domain-containing protein